MSRLLRYANHTLFLACALLSVAAGLMAGRSYAFYERLASPHDQSKRSVTFYSNWGRLGFNMVTWMEPEPRTRIPKRVRWEYTRPYASARPPDRPQMESRPDLKEWQLAGITVRRSKPIPGSQSPRFYAAQFSLTLPWWYLSVLFGLPPGIWVTRRLVKRRWPLRGHCVRCGYDLRATPDRCPECGTTTSPAPPGKT